MMPVLTFSPRFVRAEHLGELSNLWHLSRVPHGLNRYNRMLWTSAQFAKTHEYVTPTGAYKDLDNMLDFGGH